MKKRTLKLDREVLTSSEIAPDGGEVDVVDTLLIVASRWWGLCLAISAAITISQVTTQPTVTQGCPPPN